MQCGAFVIEITGILLCFIKKKHSNVAHKSVTSFLMYVNKIIVKKFTVERYKIGDVLWMKQTAN